VDTGTDPVYRCAPARIDAATRQRAFAWERLMHRSFWSAILTDIHFWVPVVVLAFGVGLLMSLR
jgi:hypothetical protein